MAFHDTACVPPLSEGEQAVQAGPAPGPGETGFPPVQKIPSLRSGAGLARTERVRAILEMQVSTGEAMEGARILPWVPRQKRVPIGAPVVREALLRGELRSG